MHVILARIHGKHTALAFVDGNAQMVNMRDWSGFCRDHKGATLFGLDVSWTAEPEDIKPEDSFDSAEDVVWVKEQLRAGNDFAWFCAIVTAKRGDDSAITALGGCSYRSEEDFTTADGYFADLVHEAASELQTRFIASFGTFETI